MDLKARQEEMQRRNRGPRRGRPLGTAFKDITPACVAGVYLLYTGGDFYIGQAANVVGRYMAHVIDLPDSQWPRLILLREEREKEARLQAERRFIAAARVLGLMMTNRLIYQEPTDAVKKEVSYLQYVIKILSTQ